MAGFEVWIGAEIWIDGVVVVGGKDLLIKLVRLNLLMGSPVIAELISFVLMLGGFWISNRLVL